MEVLKEGLMPTMLAIQFDLHQNQISNWKQEFLNSTKGAFTRKQSEIVKTEVDLKELYTKIEELAKERDFLKKLSQMRSIESLVGIF